MTAAAGARIRSLAARLCRVLAWACTGGACSGPEALDPVWIEDFLLQAPVLACATVPELTREGLVVDDLVLTPSGGILVLSGRARQVLLLDGSARIVWRLALEEEGPAGVGSPVSVDLADDSTLLVADPGRMVVKRLGLQGQDRGTVRTPFSPLRVRRAGGAEYVIPGVVGGFPDRLLFRIEGGRLLPQDLPLRRYPGMTHGSFANRLGAVAGPDGSLLLLHGFYVPEVYRWTGASATRRPVPLPDGVAHLFLDPRPVEREEDLGHLPVVALSPFTVRETGDVVYLTRSGARLGSDVREKALIRVDSAFHYRASGRLPVDALLAAPLNGDEVLVVSGEGSWHRCQAP